MPTTSADASASGAGGGGGGGGGAAAAAERSRSDARRRDRTPPVRKSAGGAGALGADGEAEGEEGGGLGLGAAAKGAGGGAEVAASGAGVGLDAGALRLPSADAADGANGAHGANGADGASGAAASAPPPPGSPLVHWPDAMGARGQRMAIAALLLVGMLLVLLGSASYCWLETGRAEMADSYRHRSHVAEAEDDGESNCSVCVVEEEDSHHVLPALQVNRHFVAEVVSGGLNGLLMMVATVLGGIGADLSGRSIFALGSASLAAYSASAGFATFLVESTKEEFAVAQLEEERHEVQTMPHEEIREMICHYRKRGIAEEDAHAVAAILSKYENFWIEHMMAEELGIHMPRGDSVAIGAGLATGASLLLFGMLPLLGVASSVALSYWRGPQWYRPQFATYISLALSAGAVALLGIFISRAAGSRTPFINGLLMLINGCGASLLAFSASQLLTRLNPRRSSASGARAAPETPLSSPSGRNSAAAAAAAATAAAAEAAAAVAERTPASPQHYHQHHSLAWPSFRSMFLRGLCMLWVAACTVIVGVQLFERMAYASLRVFMYGWLTCITTGLGALPFLFIGSEAVGERSLAIANAAAGGMMLAASGSMLVEAHEYCGPKDWQILVGLAVGALFIRCSEALHSFDGEEGEEDDVVALHTALVERRHLRKAMLIFTVMFFHSAAEGVAVGVAFSRNLREEFGLYVTLLLAVHNVPEGLAVALVLVPRGVSTPLASLIATLTSVPQPLLALASFLFVDAFSGLLPLGLAFAAGAMVYVCLHELITEAVEQLGWRAALFTTAASFVLMTVTIIGLQGATGA